MFLVNSRLGLFTATSLSFYVCIFFTRYPFSRSYGAILPSSLTIVLPLVLGFSPHLPVSVYGTGDSLLDRSFSRQHGFTDFSTCIFRSPSRLSVFEERDLPLSSTFTLSRTLPVVRFRYPSASLHFSNASSRYRNFYLLSITYAFQPWLRSRLTLRGRAFLRNP